MDPRTAFLLRGEESQSTTSTESVDSEERLKVWKDDILPNLEESVTQHRDTMVAYTIREVTDHLNSID